jgi:hypothetical protein
MSGETGPPLDICIDLDQESLAMRTAGGIEIGEWSLETVHITGRDNGFTFEIEGDPAWVRTDDDGAFATEIGLRWAPPRLRRLMAVHSRPMDQDRVLA